MQKILTRLIQSPKRFLLSGVMALCLLLTAFAPLTAMAATTSESTTKCAANDVKCLIQFGDQQITSRLDDLNKLSEKVTDDQQKNVIDNDHAVSIQGDITTAVNGLTALKTTLDAETDAKSARQDVASIYTKFRIYAVVLPREYRRLHLAIEIVVDKKLTDLKSSIEQSIDNAPAAKKAELNQLYTDYKGQLSDAETNIDNAQKAWPILTPDSYNDSRSTYDANLKSLTADEQAAHSDLHKAADDLHKIVKDLKTK